jgi:hypothetical protein
MVASVKEHITYDSGLPSVLATTLLASRISASFFSLSSDSVELWLMISVGWSTTDWRWKGLLAFLAVAVRRGVAPRKAAAWVGVVNG